MTSQGLDVEQAQLELQLKVWKELAISKQMLMRAATDALKLDHNCSQDELKKALEAALKKIAEADATVQNAQEQAKSAVAAMEKKLATVTQAQTIAEATVAELTKAQEDTAKQNTAARAAAAKDLQTLKDRLAEKEKALKAVNTALADTPENVLKKMKALKKEKQDEADARRQVEATVATLRKEKREQDQQQTELLEKSVKLVTQHRDLHALSLKLHEQLKPLVEEKELTAVPDLDTQLLEDIEQANSKQKK